MLHGPHKHTCGSPGTGPRWVGDPVDVVTGHNVLSLRDFVVPGPMKLEFRRFYDHTWAGQDARGLGRGFRHGFDQWLSVDLDGLTHTTAEAGEIRFPFLDRDGEEATSGGYRLLRVGAEHYRLARHAEPTRVFGPGPSGRHLRLEALERDGAVLRLHYQGDRLHGLGIDHRRHIELVYGRNEQMAEIRLHLDARPHHALVRYRYDELDRLVEVEDVKGRRFTLAYDARHRLVESVDPSGYAFSFAYDASNRCVRTVGRDGLLSVELAYEPMARQTRVTDGNGASWLYEYDQYERLIRITDPYGGETLFEYGPAGGLTAEIDPEGRRTEYLHDPAGAQYAKRNPDGTIEALLAPEVTVPRHRVPRIAIEWEYGDDWALDFGLPGAAEVPPALPNAVAQALTLSEHPLRGRVEDVYDEAGFLAEQRLEDGRTRRFVHSHRGTRHGYGDFDGGGWKLETQSWDLPYREHDPHGFVSEFRYTTTGELTEFIDPAGNRVQWTYDLKDRLVAVTRNGEVHDRYEYDGGDELIAKRDGRGQLLLELERDSSGRVVRRKFASGQEYTYVYDDRGNKLEANTRTSRGRFGWDAGRRVLDERDGKGVSRRFRGGHLCEVTVLGFTTTYEREGSDVVIRDPTGASHRIRMHGSGVFTREFANGWNETAQYSPRGWCLLKAAWHESAPDRPWIRRYLHSGEGDLLRVEDSARGVTYHTYDRTHRLVASQRPGGEIDRYGYGKADNLQHKPGLEEVAIGSANRVTYADGHRFEYDVRQNISVVRGPDGSRTEYRYDGHDQLVGVLKDDREWWTADYDALGRRIHKDVGGERTSYYWDGDRLQAELLPDGGLRIYVYVDAFAMVPVLFVDYENEAAEPASGKTHVVFADQRGCPEKVIDAEGRVAWAAYVEPYGWAHVTAGHDLHQPLRFPGHWWDAELGMHYNRFRYYSPWLGRYWQTDPIGEQGGRNTYAYPGNPLTRVDVRGLTLGCEGDDTGTVETGEDGTNQQRPPKTTPPETAETPTPRPMKLTPEQAEAIARHEAERYRQEIDAAIANGTPIDIGGGRTRRLNPGQAGPVVVVVVDRRTGDYFRAINDPGKQPPTNLHPALQGRVNWSQENRRHASRPGTHGEIHAMNDALHARDATHQPDSSAPRATEDDVNEMTVLPIWREDRGRMRAGEDAPRCGNCEVGTDGAHAPGDPPPGTFDHDMGNQELTPAARDWQPGDRPWANTDGS